MADNDDEGRLANLQQELKDMLTRPQGGAGQTGSMQQGLSTEDKQRQFEECQAIAAPFMSAKGKKALEALRRKTVDQPTWPFRQVEATALPYYGCAREGQNQLVRYIEWCIKTVESGPPTGAEGE